VVREKAASTQSAPTNGRIKMITKGGSWLTSAGEIYGLAFVRNTAGRLQWGIDTGFRCAKDAKGDKPPEGMIRIPANKYHLGGDDSRLMEIYRKLRVNYRLSVEVFIDYDQEALSVHAFMIDKYEVTNGQFNQFLS
jgi:formylglycine-generating enzyme required for sulfatase activity